MIDGRAMMVKMKQHSHDGLSKVKGWNITVAVWYSCVDKIASIIQRKFIQVKFSIKTSSNKVLA